MKKIMFLLLLLFSSTSLPSTSLLIKIPTRNRPQQILKTLVNFYEHLSGRHNVSFILSMNADDQTMNNPRMKEALSNFPNLSYYYGSHQNKIEAYNADIDKHPFDILLVASDDMEVIAKDFDEIVINKMLNFFPDFDGVLNFNDGNVRAELNTMPIIGKAYYERFGYVYFPEYKSLCCDWELTLISKTTFKEAICTETIIKHNHPGFNPKIPLDELYIKNQKYFEEDRDLFHKRKQFNFGLPSEAKLWSILIGCSNGQANSNLQNQKKATLIKQIKNLGLEQSVEIITIDSPMPFEEQLEKFYKNSNSQYVSYLDQNDLIKTNYVRLIHSVLKNYPDYIDISLNKPLSQFYNPCKRWIAIQLLPKHNTNINFLIKSQLISKKEVIHV